MTMQVDLDAPTTTVTKDQVAVICQEWGPGSRPPGSPQGQRVPQPYGAAWNSILTEKAA